MIFRKQNNVIYLGLFMHKIVEVFMTIPLLIHGLGKSEISQFYGINGREEAYEYIANEKLCNRLVEATETVLNNEHSVYDIFGDDTVKFRACMLLFASVSDIPVFKQVIKKYHW